MTHAEQFSQSAISNVFAAGLLCLEICVAIVVNGVIELRKPPAERTEDLWLGLGVLVGVLPYSYFAYDPELGLELYYDMGIGRTIFAPLLAIICTATAIRALQTGNIRLGDRLSDGVPAHRNGSAHSRGRFKNAIVFCVVFAALGWIGTVALVMNFI